MPGSAVTLEIGADIEGVGVDPRYPPRVWEAWTGNGWTACDIEQDTTGGLNRDGQVILHLPKDHTAHAGILRLSGGWVRCRVTESQEWQPAYQRVAPDPLDHGMDQWRVGRVRQRRHRP